MSPALAKGLAFGFLLAATVGPMWSLCLRRTLAHGRLYGFVSGLGVASADAIYGFIAAFGLTAVSGFLLAQQFWFSLLGGGFLVWMGAGILRSAQRPAALSATEAAARGASGLAAAYGSTLALTLTNPATILAFVAIFAGLGLAQNASYAEATLVVAGVAIGSCAWWLLLTLGAGWLRARLHGPRGPALLRAINIFAGASILAFGAVQLGTLAVK